MATIRWWRLVLWASLFAAGCGALSAQQPEHAAPENSAQDAERFFAQRNLGHIRGSDPAELLQRARAQHRALANDAGSGTTPLNAPWVSLGPTAVTTARFGAISGRITSIAADPSNGNVVYIGTTGGGIWKSKDAASASPSFNSLTDTLPTSSNCSTPALASLSIGALTVQPGETGVVLAGTGDPNDALDSYYGTGILRSTDTGATWCLIPNSMDAYYGALRGYSFRGMGFAGFAWSTVNPQLVVAAVAQSAEGAVVNAESASSFAGLYYSTDAGQTWLLATITDGPQKIIQSSQSASSSSSGNSATSVTWNPVRKRFYAAIRYHGYYESSDGITWTRLDHQPGVNLFPAQCPANPDGVGSPACPIYRGTIASQPVTGDLFAITVDSTGSDQGLWQDICNASSSGCASDTVTFSRQIQDAAIDTGGGANIPQGDYALSLVAVPAQQDTLLFVGARDIFRCSLANSCAWRNTTNVDTCAAARVAPSQHAFDATFGASGLIYFGNDGGLWRTTNAINQQQTTCSSDDANSFQNLNGGIGSLAEISSFSQHPQNENVLMAAMGAFGTASTQTASGVWTQILDGEGDENAIDPSNPQNWYTTSAAPISINLCAQGTACDKTAFGSPVIGNAQVGNDGYGLTGTAPWILDPQNTANLIIGTCRVWRGPGANGAAWNAGNIISPVLDTVQNAFCNGNAQIRSLAASGNPSDPPGAAERIYAGMAGAADGGATVAGHIYGATVSSAEGETPKWTDLTNSPVLNNDASFNTGGFDVSSIYVDPHDSTGNTLYVTIQGFVPSGGSEVYRSLDGGADWIGISSNLPTAPANSILVDPNDANTVYVALDTGVYVTRNINQCTDRAQSCWSILGTGLPGAPVTQLRAYNYLTTSLLRASTYGRGIWQIPLVTSGIAESTAALTPATLTFASQRVNTVSSPQTVTIKNTGTVTLTISSIAISQNFAEQDDCAQALLPGAGCSIQVSFAPAATGALQGTLTVYGNMPTGQVATTLSGTGLAAGDIVLLPGSINFGNAPVGTSTPAQNITISNTGGVNVSLQTPSVTGDFQISANTCGSSLPPNTGCTVSVQFAPTAAGGRAGVFSIHDDEGTQSVQLSGTGQAVATAVLSGTSLNFSQPQTVGTRSAPQQITLTNTGDVSLSDITIKVSGDFTAQNDCGSFLTGHSTCAISVVFVPTRVGVETGLLTVNTVLGTQTVALSGIGQPPNGISALPSSLDFGGQGLSSTSTPQQIVLANSTGLPLTGLNFAVSGDFALSGSNCASGGTLNAQSSCALSLTFTPSQTGARSGSLVVSATNLAPMTVPLSGVGEDFQLAISGSSSAVIVPGQTATYAVQVIPAAGSSGTLALSCSGAPQSAACNVNPGTMPVQSGVTGYATITVTTAAGTDTALSSALRKAGLMLSALLPCIFLDFRNRRRWLHLWLICLGTAALLLPLACGVHATGGGSSGSSPSQGSGSVYTLTVTASVPGLAKSVPLTLTIQ